jgi:hypothetical protein
MGVGCEVEKSSEIAQVIVGFNNNRKVKEIKEIWRHKNQRSGPTSDHGSPYHHASFGSACLIPARDDDKPGTSMQR